MSDIVIKSLKVAIKKCKTLDELNELKRSKPFQDKYHISDIHKLYGDKYIKIKGFITKEEYSRLGIRTMKSKMSVKITKKNFLYVQYIRMYEGSFKLNRHVKQKIHNDETYWYVYSNLKLASSFGIKQLDRKYLKSKLELYESEPQHNPFDTDININEIIKDLKKLKSISVENYSNNDLHISMFLNGYGYIAYSYNDVIYYQVCGTRVYVDISPSKTVCRNHNISAIKIRDQLKSLEALSYSLLKELF